MYICTDFSSINAWNYADVFGFVSRTGHLDAGVLGVCRSGYGDFRRSDGADAHRHGQQRYGCGLRRCRHDGLRRRHLVVQHQKLRQFPGRFRLGRRVSRRCHREQVAAVLCGSAGGRGVCADVLLYQETDEKAGAQRGFPHRRLCGQVGGRVSAHSCWQERQGQSAGKLERIGAGD